MLIKINFIESSPKLKTCFENKLVLLKEWNSWFGGS